MGGDGGTFGVNRNYMRGARLHSREEVADRSEEAISRYTTCAVSGEPLREPIVACELGFLYDKEQVIKHLIHKTMPSNFKHIRSLKELIDCKFTMNPAYKPTTSSTTSSAVAYWSDPTNGTARFICPVTMIEVNGKQDFCVLKPSGKVLSMKALLELPTLSDGQTVIKLFPTDNELRANRERLSRERFAKKKAKQDKKLRKRKRETKTSGEEGASSSKSESASSLLREIKATADASHPGSPDNKVGGLKEKPGNDHEEKLKQNSVYAELFTSSKKDQDVDESERKKRLFA